LLLSEAELKQLLDGYEPFIGVRLNLAVFGEAVSGTTGTSNDVSNSVDRSLLRHLRSQADVIVTSGETARAEGLKPSKFAPLVVLTNAEDLTGLDALLHTAGASSVTLLTQQSNAQTLLLCANEANSSVKVSAAETLEPQAVLAWLQFQGYRRILVEFGPTLISLWSEANLIDEVCLTQTGLSAGLPAFLKGNWRLVHRSDLAAEGTSFLFDRL